MEHRHYPRMDISIEVDLFRRDQHLGHAQTKDISLCGMMLQNDEPVLKRNDVIVLRIWMEGMEQVMHGLVIHTANKCAGVMLIDMSKDASRAIFHYLREMDGPLKKALGTMEQRSAT